MLYESCITRPDIAFASSYLFRFNNNPSPKYYCAANRVLQYLGKTYAFAFQLGGSNNFKTYSNALFANNTVNWRSLQAYIIKLFKKIVG